MKYLLHKTLFWLLLFFPIAYGYTENHQYHNNVTFVTGNDSHHSSGQRGHRNDYPSGHTRRPMIGTGTGSGHYKELCAQVIELQERYVYCVADKKDELTTYYCAPRSKYDWPASSEAQSRLETLNGEISEQEQKSGAWRWFTTSNLESKTQDYDLLCKKIERDALTAIIPSLKIQEREALIQQQLHSVSRLPETLDSEITYLEQFTGDPLLQNALAQTRSCNGRTYRVRYDVPCEAERLMTNAGFTAQDRGLCQNYNGNHVQHYFHEQLLQNYKDLATLRPLDEEEDELIYEVATIGMHMHQCTTNNAVVKSYHYNNFFRDSVTYIGHVLRFGYAIGKGIVRY